MKKLTSLALGLVCFASVCAAAGPPPPIYRTWATTNLQPDSLNIVTQIALSMTEAGGISLTTATNVSAGVTRDILIASNALWVARNDGTSSNQTLHGTAKLGTNAVLEVRVQDDLGSDAFGIQLLGYHGMAAPSWSLGNNITWTVPDESGFAIGMSLTITNVQDPTILANGSTFDNTMVGLGYSMLATNGSFAIGRNNRSWGANAGTLGVGLSNGVANTIDIGLHDPTKLSVGTNLLTIRTPILANNLASNASPVSFAAFLADGTMVETETPSGAALSQTLQNIADATVQRQTNQSGLAKDSNIQFMNAAETVLIDVAFNSTVLDFPQGFTSPSAVINSVDLAPWVTFLGIADPNADRLMFWDDSAGTFTYLTLGTGLSIADTTINATGTGTPDGDSAAIQFNQGDAFAGTNRFIYNRSNDSVRVIGSGGYRSEDPILLRTNILDWRGAGSEDTAPFGLFSWGTNRWQIEGSASGNILGALVPASSNAYDIGRTNLPVRAIHANSITVNDSIAAVSLTASAGAKLANTVTTNYQARTPTNIVGTNFVVDFDGRSVVRAIPTAESQIVFTNVPAAGTETRDVLVQVINPDGYPITIATSLVVRLKGDSFTGTNFPSNLYYSWDSSNVWITSEFEEHTGTGPSVRQTNATIHSPMLTGSPTAPTKLPEDNSTNVATTAYVDEAVSSVSTAFNRTNIIVSSTNNVIWDIGNFDFAEGQGLTNLNLLVISNQVNMTKESFLSWQNDTNGTRELLGFTMAGGVLRTNASKSMRPGTNANELTIFKFLPDPLFNSNVVGSIWETNLQPVIPFTNSLAGAANPISYRSQTSSNFSATAITLTKPAGTAEGDILVWMLATDNSALVTYPSGFTVVASNATFGAAGFEVAYKVAGGSEPADYTFDFNAATEGGVAVLLAYSGATSFEDVDFEAGAPGAGVPHTTPVITPSQNNAMLVGAMFIDPTGTTVVSEVTGFPLRVNMSRSNAASLGVAEKLQSTATAEGVQMTEDAGGSWGEYTFALIP